MLGYTVEEMTGKKWPDFTHPEDIQRNTDLLSALLDGEKNSIEFEKQYLHKDGGLIDTLISTTL